MSSRNINDFILEQIKALAQNTVPPATPTVHKELFKPYGLAEPFNFQFSPDIPDVQGMLFRPKRT